MPGYIYAQDEDDLYVNLFVSNNATIKLTSTDVKLTQQTEYPWQGKVNINVDPAKKSSFYHAYSLPGWAANQPVTGSDLYSFMNKDAANIPIYVNGKKVNYKTEKGYAIINRTGIKAIK